MGIFQYVSDFHSHDESESTLRLPQPCKALVFFSSGSTVTEHDIYPHGDHFQMGAAKPLSAMALRRLEMALRDTSDELELIPANTLHLTADSVLWYLPSTVRPMRFRRDDVAIEVTVPWPALLLRGSLISRELFVYALASDERPTHSTSVYHAPLMNIGIQGQMCFGAVQLPRRRAGVAARQQAMESALFDSYFTHCNDGTDTDQNLHFWRELDGQNTFPTKTLKATKKTVQGVLRHAR